MVKNDVIGHTEDRTNPWFTPEGLEAAQRGNVMASSREATPDRAAIDLWMVGPFHAIGIIDPQLLRTGFGSYREAGGSVAMGATLNVLSETGPVPAGQEFPIFFPRDGGEMPLLSYEGGETPDPLTGCPGYGTGRVTTGPPIMIQVGSGSTTPRVTAHRISSGGQTLQSCAYDETSYTNPDAERQQLGRAVLGSRDAVVILPRQPLVSGRTYEVSLTNAGETYMWSLTARRPATGAAADKAALLTGTPPLLVGLDQ
jgi:hypothetical protein